MQNSMNRQWPKCGHSCWLALVLRSAAAVINWSANRHCCRRMPRQFTSRPFINRSRDIGMEKELTSALRGEFYRRGQLRVVDRPSRPTSYLAGWFVRWRPPWHRSTATMRCCNMNRCSF